MFILSSVWENTKEITFTWKMDTLHGTLENRKLIEN